MWPRKAQGQKRGELGHTGWLAEQEAAIRSQSWVLTQSSLHPSHCLGDGNVFCSNQVPLGGLWGENSPQKQQARHGQS